MVGQKRPRIGGPTRSQTPSAYLRPSYPLAGCSPAEPASVSPGEKAIPQGCRRCKINQELPVRKAGKSVAKEWPFFVQRTGSTSGERLPGFLHLISAPIYRPLLPTDRSPRYGRTPG